MLRIHFANRIESLARRLLMRLVRPGAGVFDTQTVIVPSAAHRRWLTLAIADTLGVCAQVEFPYLGPWLWRQVAALVPHAGGLAAVDTRVLGWRLLAAFADHDFTAAHPRLHSYLGAADDVMRHELARRVASVFDHYATYRPDWAAAWQRGDTVDLGAAGPNAQADARWQADLWQRLAASAGEGDEGGDGVAALFGALDRLRPADAIALALPPTAHVFALPAMPPLHIELLRRLGNLIDVDLYVVNPCREYWFEIVDPRRLRHLVAQGRAQRHEIGNRLLASWGRQTQAHIDTLVDRLDAAVIDDTDFEPAAGHTLLATLHDAILEMRELAPGSVELAADDRSIEVHVCHSRTRELEALHDHLLGLFASGAIDHPSQVLVVTPDLDAVAPLVDAVFGSAPAQRRIPYTVSGRARSQANAPARALLALLALVPSRFAASEVVALLRHAVIARRFGFDADALDLVHGWLRDAGARWGLDAGHRAGFDLPPTADHTWAQALERLFLGYALPDRAASFAGLLPAGAPEGSAATTLGALWHFISRLAALRAATAAPLPAPAWREWLLTTIDDFFVTQGDEIDDAGELRDAIAALVDDWRAAGFDSPGAPALQLPLVAQALAEQLDAPPHGGVPGGGVTFTAMGSLRGLPFAVVCAIGLDDGAFPTAQRPAEFDLMALAPRRGDRQRRDDERNLFLDLLLAARRSVYFSYVGRSQRDHAPLPPSVLVAELLDVLVPAIATDPRSAADLEKARKRLVVEHPLQPFAIEAFGRNEDPRRRSFDAELADALRQRLRAAPVAAQAEAGDDGGDERSEDPLPPFVTQSLPPPGPEWRDVTLDRLTEFFRQPCRYFLRRRLGIALAWSEEELLDDEPFVIDPMVRRALAQRLLEPLIAGLGPQAAQELALASGVWPGGSTGRVQLEDELAALQRFATRVRERTAEPCLDVHTVRLAFDLDGEAWSLQAAFADLRRSGLTRWRAGKLGAGDRLHAWLAHLVLAASPPPHWSGRTCWLATDSSLLLKAPPKAAAELLYALLRLYRDGLREPLRFYPRSSWAFVASQGSIDKAWAKWRSEFDPSLAEGNDPAYRLALRGCADPFAGAFAEVAGAVFGPLREAAEEEPAR